MQSQPDCAERTFQFPNSSSKKLVVGILNIMPSVDRVATENMFLRRFKGFEHTIEIHWLHPDADQPDFQHTDNRYTVPDKSAYSKIDYLFRTGACAAFIAPEENKFLQCLRDSLSFDKGSTSFCWSAGQIYADATGQSYSDLLIGKDDEGIPIKRAGYFEYKLAVDEYKYFTPPEGWYMAVSRHIKIDSISQRDLMEKHGFEPFAISTTGNDIAGLIKGNHLMLLTHPDYDPSRLVYEGRRNIRKAATHEEKSRLRSILSRQFPEYRSMQEAADQAGQSLFNAILWQAIEAKYPSINHELTVQRHWAVA